MIEAGANEVPEQQMIEAIFKAHEVNQKVIKLLIRSLQSVESRNMSMRALLFRKSSLMR